MNGLHCMLDFETLGQRPSTAVLSLGAVLFERERICKQQYWTFDVNEQIKLGRTVDFSTLQWWMKQGSEAKSVFQASGGVTVGKFRLEFLDFIGCADYAGSSEIKLWGNGADFDVSIFYDFWTRTGNFPTPFKFWNTRCFRTFNALRNCKDLVARKGTHHNALDDAVYQAECVIASLREKP